MIKNLTGEILPYKWAVPDRLNIPPDELVVRLDFYKDSIMLFTIEKGITTAKHVSAEDISAALLSEINWSSGLLPKETLWWKQTKHAAQVALWRKPQVWPVALQLEPFKPALRFKLPMPGLIFICSTGQAPFVYAMKHRPVSIHDRVYHAPLFNTYSNGSTCPGTHKYPQDIEKIPESFFSAFFTKGGVPNNRSKKYHGDLLKLWEEIDGEPKFPKDDLIEYGSVADLLK
jgi:PRTRC genetic system protein B